MKTIKLIKHAVLAIAVATFAAGSFLQAAIPVYDNSTGDLNTRLNPGANEIGDEIVLGGPAERVISDFTFQYWGQTFGGNEQARLRFYLNDGPASPAGPLTPSTVFYDSGLFAITATTRSTLIFTDFVTDAVVPLVGPLPNTFTWTVTFQGVGAGESAGVDLYNPPTVGGNFLEYWENTGGGWEYRGEPNGVPANFGAIVNVVPEPSMIALGLIGGLAALGIRNRFKRS